MAMFPSRRPRQKASLLTEFDAEVAAQNAAREVAQRAEPLTPWSGTEAVAAARATPAPAAPPPITPPIPTVIAPELPAAVTLGREPAGGKGGNEPFGTEVLPPSSVAAPASIPAPLPATRAAIVEPLADTGRTPPLADARPAPVEAEANVTSTFEEPPASDDVQVRLGRSRRPRIGAGAYAVAAALALLVGGGGWFMAHRPASPPRSVARLAPPPTDVPVASRAPVPLPRSSARLASEPSAASEIAVAPSPAVRLALPVAVMPARRARRAVAREEAIASAPHRRRPTPVAVASRGAVPPAAPREDGIAPPRLAGTPVLRAPAAPAPSTGAVQLASTTTDPASRNSDDLPGKRKRATRRAAIDAIRALQMR